MLNFNYSMPTSIFFGRNQVEVLPEQIRNFGSKVLLTYGMGSIKENGIFHKISQILKENDIDFYELGGIEPNPDIESVREGIKICKENNIDLILSVGGGSTIDCSKMIAVGHYYDGDPWDILSQKIEITKALPIGVVLTMAGTGSEMDSVAVIANRKTKQKLSIMDNIVIPKFSILDPTYTFTVPKNQTAAGVADIMSHALESYFTLNDGAYLQNRFAEAILKTCIKYGKVACDEPNNYEARANIMWAASNATNGLIYCGKNINWSVHGIEVGLNTYYDLTHGIGLSILTPIWMKYVLDDERVDNFVEYGVNVWGIDKDKDRYKIANEAIDKTKRFFVSMGLPQTLREVGIGDENLENIARYSIDSQEGNVIGNFRPLNYDDVLAILREAL